MATNEPVEDSIHEAGDEGHTDSKQFIGKENAIDDDGSRQAPSIEDEGEQHVDNKKNDKEDEHDHDGDDEDEDLEEGELKDDDDDDDDDDDALANSTSSNTRFSIFNNNNNNDSNNNSNNNTGSHNKDLSSSDQRLHNDPNHQNNSASGDARGPHSHRPYQRQQHHRRHFSPNHPQNHPGMHHHNFPQNPNHFPMNSNNNLYGFQPPHDMGGGPPPPVMPPQMNHHPITGPMSGEIYPSGPPTGMGPMQKGNVRCRFYSKTNNKCTWGDDCRFEHRDDSPEPNEAFNDRIIGPDGGPMRGPGPGGPHMGIHDRVYPPYRHQTYPQPMPPHAYGYGPYDHQPFGPHLSNSPPLPGHPAPPNHWRQQHSPYPPASSNHPPESVSPSVLSNSGGVQALPAPGAGNRLPSTQPMGGTPVPAAPSSGGAPSPGYSSPSSSSAVYERKHRLAYEVAPWNDRGYSSNRYDRGDPAAVYHPAASRGGYYRGQYGREPYGREPPPHMAGGPYPYHYGYPANHPSAYRGGPPMGSHAPHYRYSSSSQRNIPPDARRSRSNKRTRDGDSSWSDTGSDDSILGEASSSRSHANKISKRDDYQRTANQANEKPADNEQVDQEGSGTPPGEPLPEDKERQEMLLNKLKEIEDLMAKKKEKQDETL